MSSKMRSSRVRRGFTLIEALMAVLLMGIAMVSILMSSSSFTQANGMGVDLSTAEFLIEEVRERTASMTFDEVNTFAGGSPFSPPIDIEGAALANFSMFSQVVTFTTVSPSNFDTAQAGSDFARVTVTILQNGEQVTSASWIRANY